MATVPQPEGIYKQAERAKHIEMLHQQLGPRSRARVRLLFAGLLTSVSVSALGAVLALPVVSAGSAKFSLTSTKSLCRSF